MKTVSDGISTNTTGERKSNLSWAVARTGLYWLFTLPVAFEMMAGGVWDLLRIEYVRVVLTHLGYPLYLLTILGVWKIPCAVVILVPRFLRLKEWAYAGAVFTYTGAVASHVFAGDGAELWVPPLVLTFFTAASWVLRPDERRLISASVSKTEVRPLQWAVSVLIAVVFLILSFLTLPQGPPPALSGT